VARALITTDYLRPGDEVDRYLTSHGVETVHAPLVGRRDPEQLVELLEGVDAALVANEPMTAEVLARAPRLRAVVRTGVGYDSIDVAAAARHGISVSNLPGINANAVAEYTLGLLLAVARRIVRSAACVSAGAWPREEGHELRGATLGLVGYGAAVRAVVPLAQAFGMTVLCTTGLPADRRGRPSDSSRCPSCWRSPTTSRCTPRSPSTPAA
jgi:phosphoglycerate dehydrogenase-like enzyme